MAFYNRPSISSKKSQPQPCDNTRAILRSQEIREGGCKSSIPSTTQDPTSSHHSLLLRTLKLDASEPWERSLLCSLKDATFNKSVRDPGQHDVMLLQHTESRDQALKMDDEDDQSLLSAYGVTGVAAPSLRNSIYRTSTRVPPRNIPLGPERDAFCFDHQQLLQGPERNPSLQYHVLGYGSRLLRRRQRRPGRRTPVDGSRATCVRFRRASHEPPVWTLSPHVSANHARQRHYRSAARQLQRPRPRRVPRRL